MDRREAPGGLADPIVPQAVPVGGSIPVKESSILPMADEELPSAQTPCGRSCPARARVLRLSEDEDVDGLARGVEEQDLVACIRKAQIAAHHVRGTVPAPDEIGVFEEVFPVGRRVTCRDDSDARCERHAMWEPGGRLAVA